MKNFLGKISESKLKIICLITLFIIIQTFLLIRFHKYANLPNQAYKSYTYTTPAPTLRDITPKMAIIIDDFGQSRKGVKEIMSIQKPLTFAIMPFLDFSKQDAVNAHEKGFEVMVHLPMQSTDSDIAAWLGPQPITLSLTDAEIKRTVLESIDAIPYAAGVNIHMGTMASENERLMSRVMETVKERNLYFIDSKTSSNSICRTAAEKTGIPFAERDIFLENAAKDKLYIENQLEHASRIAVKKGKAVVIGHVGAAGGEITARTIKEMIPVIESKGISLVFASKII